MAHLETSLDTIHKWARVRNLLLHAGPMTADEFIDAVLKMDPPVWVDNATPKVLRRRILVIMGDHWQFVRPDGSRGKWRAVV